MVPIVHVPSDIADISEQMGTKFKFWYEDPMLGRTLFKEGRPNTGENWAEKLACELAAMLGIPHAYYELAEWRGRQGIISPRFFPEAGRLIHGNELLGGKVVDDDEGGKIKNYAQRTHTAAGVLGSMRRSTRLQPPRDFVVFPGVVEAVDVFVGYLLFDAWIANQDRHSQNWGFVRLREMLFLAHSYDHGSSLARNLSDLERASRMSTKDKGYGIEKYVLTARSAMYPASNGMVKVKPFLTIEAFEYAMRFFPVPAQAWLRRLEKITDLHTKNAIEMIPETHMSEVARQFAYRLLQLNKQRLLKLIK